MEEPVEQSDPTTLSFGFTTMSSEGWSDEGLSEVGEVPEMDAYGEQREKVPPPLHMADSSSDELDDSTGGLSSWHRPPYRSPRTAFPERRPSPRSSAAVVAVASAASKFQHNPYTVSASHAAVSSAVYRFQSSQSDEEYLTHTEELDDTEASSSAFVEDDESDGPFGRAAPYHCAESSASAASPPIPSVDSAPAALPRTISQPLRLLGEGEEDETEDETEDEDEEEEEHGMHALDLCRAFGVGFEDGASLRAPSWEMITPRSFSGGSKPNKLSGSYTAVPVAPFDADYEDEGDSSSVVVDEGPLSPAEKNRSQVKEQLERKYGRLKQDPASYRSTQILDYYESRLETRRKKLLGPSSPPSSLTASTNAASYSSAPLPQELSSSSRHRHDSVSESPDRRAGGGGGIFSSQISLSSPSSSSPGSKADRMHSSGRSRGQKTSSKALSLRGSRAPNTVAMIASCGLVALQSSALELWLAAMAPFELPMVDTSNRSAEIRVAQVPLTTLRAAQLHPIEEPASQDLVASFVVSGPSVGVTSSTLQLADVVLIAVDQAAPADAPRLQPILDDLVSAQLPVVVAVFAGAHAADSALGYRAPSFAEVYRVCLHYPRVYAVDCMHCAVPPAIAVFARILDSIL